MDLLAVLGGGGGLGHCTQRSETLCDQTPPPEVRLVNPSSFHVSEIVFDSLDFFLFFFLTIRSWLKQTFNFPLLFPPSLKRYLLFQRPRRMKINSQN